MTIYITTQGCYSDYATTGAFSTKELAEAYNKALGDAYSGIVEYELDGPAVNGVIYGGVVCSFEINVTTGDMECWSPTCIARSGDGIQSGVHMYPSSPTTLYFDVECESEELAKKLAAEAYQEYKRLVLVDKLSMADAVACMNNRRKPVEVRK